MDGYDFHYKITSISLDVSDYVTFHDRRGERFGAGESGATTEELGRRNHHGSSGRRSSSSAGAAIGCRCVCPGEWIAATCCQYVCLGERPAALGARVCVRVRDLLLLAHVYVSG